MFILVVPCFEDVNEIAAIEPTVEVGVTEVGAHEFFHPEAAIVLVDRSVPIQVIGRIQRASRYLVRQQVDVCRRHAAIAVRIDRRKEGCKTQAVCTAVEVINRVTPGRSAGRLEHEEHVVVAAAANAKVGSTVSDFDNVLRPFPHVAILIVGSIETDA